MFTDESFRVCMNGTDRADEIKGSSTRESLFKLIAVLVWLVRLSSISDLFRLCLEVRLSSKGFISGGRRDIFRKRTARYSEIINETRCRAPLTTLTRYVVFTILWVAVSNMNSEAQ